MFFQKVDLVWTPTIEFFKIFSYALTRHSSSFVEKHDLYCLSDASPSSLITIYIIQLNLDGKWWNLRLWCKVRWCVVLYSITLDVTGIHWRPFIHGRINWWWWIHVKLIWMKWECRILKNCYIRSILWVG